MGEPLPAAAFHDTAIFPSPGLAVTPLGASGLPDSEMVLEAADFPDSPSALTALTVKEYDSPVVRPVTSHTVVAHVATRRPFWS